MTHVPTDRVQPGAERWRPLRTDDGTMTLVQVELAEACHSNVGAWREARERYADACRLARRVRTGELAPSRAAPRAFRAGLRRVRPARIVAVAAALVVVVLLVLFALVNRGQPIALDFGVWSWQGDAVYAIYAGACVGLIAAAAFAGGRIRRGAIVLILGGALVLSHFGLGREMGTIRAAHGGTLVNLPKEHADRARFGKLHGVYSGLAMGLLLLGAGVLAANARVPRD